MQLERKWCRVLNWGGISGNKLAVVHIDSSRTDNETIGICDNQITISMLHVIEEEEEEEPRRNKDIGSGNLIGVEND